MSQPSPPPSICPRAVVCFVFGALSPVLLILTGIPALWMGVRALRVINASDGRLRGRRLAVAGMVLGGIGCAAFVFGSLALVFVELRVRSQRLECLNNLRQIGGAVLNYQGANNAFPPGTIPNAALAPEKRLSWLTTLPPFMEQKTKNARDAQALYEQLDLSLAWDADGNAAVAHAAVPFCRCPAHPTDDPRITKGHTHYVGLAGVGRDAAELPRGDPRAGIFGYDRVVRGADLKAGATQTLLATETARDNGPWTAGGSPTVRGLDRTDAPYIGPGRAFGGMHPHGLNVLRADGGADFMTDDTAPSFFETLTRVWREGEAP
jgi:Protein of unknown function (DUF1559)/Domain of unknown function (DUF4190)